MFFPKPNRRNRTGKKKKELKEKRPRQPETKTENDERRFTKQLLMNSSDDCSSIRCIPEDPNKRIKKKIRTRHRRFRTDPRTLCGESFRLLRTRRRQDTKSKIALAGSRVFFPHL